MPRTKMSSKPRKQRKGHFRAPNHVLAREMASHLSDELIKKYKVRSIPIRKGDTVKVVRGAFKDHTNKVVDIDREGRYICVDGATITKADGTQIAKPIHHSNVIITKLDLSDPWRKDKIDSLGGGGK